LITFTTHFSGKKYKKFIVLQKNVKKSCKKNMESVKKYKIYKETKKKFVICKIADQDYQD